MFPDRTLSELSYWFPKLQADGLPVPSTILLEMSNECMRDLFHVFDGDPPGPAFDPFAEEVKKAADSLGYPCFLRTGQTSAKHSWRDTCYIGGPGEIRSHIFNIVEFSEIADMAGLPWGKWAVREFLPTAPLAVCPRYSGMPVNREFRFFVDDGKVRCFHPYWPKEALRIGGADLDEASFNLLCTMEDEDESALRGYASRAGMAVGGSWSVDLLETKNGWYLTDMAVAKDSFHWDGCPLASSMERGEGDLP